MKKRIMLVEDDPSVLKMTRVRLAHEGFEVVTATDGEEALGKIMGDGAIDLVLLDIKLPKLDGFEVCKRLKQNPATAQLPIIVFTASSTSWQKITDQCIELGVADWIKKPFRSKDLLNRVHRALGEEENTHG